MRPQHPTPLRLWWHSPLVVRLVPAVALIAATGAGVAANLPTTSEQPHAGRPPQQITTLAPTPAPPPPPVTTTAAPTTSTPPSSTPTTTRSSPRTTSTTSTTTTTPPQTDTPTSTTTTTSRSSSQRPPVVAEGQSCDAPGDVVRGRNGERYVCDDDDGTWRWREW